MRTSRSLLSSLYEVEDQQETDIAYTLRTRQTLSPIWIGLSPPFPPLLERG